jgi:hypothetical protein
VLDLTVDPDAGPRWLGDATADAAVVGPSWGSRRSTTPNMVTRPLL